MILDGEAPNLYKACFPVFSPSYQLQHHHNHTIHHHHITTRYNSTQQHQPTTYNKTSETTKGANTATTTEPNYTAQSYQHNEGKGNSRS